MTPIKTLIHELNEMVLQGKPLDAFEKFYADDVVMQENNLPPTVGKNANRSREENFFASLIDFRSAKVLDVAVGENTTMVQWQYDYTHKDWGVRNYTQVSVQRWRDNKIVHEQFFYGS
ncbi:MAG TPA: nuclear transport factor 2 family protein [Chryseosolibacter sp.]